jgi:hypothetical protein
VNKQTLIPLAEEVQRLLKETGSTLSWIPGVDNKQANSLAQKTFNNFVAQEVK